MIEQRPMIGRAPELAELASACAAIRDGRGACALVTGEAGIGKTHLVSHALARAGLRVQRGAARATVSEPYGPITEILRSCLRGAPELPEAWGSLAPYLAPLLPEIGIAPRDAGEATLIAAILQAFGELGGRGPVAIVLDDLQWADEATLLLLPRLAEGLRDAPVLLVGIARDEVPADVHRLRRLRAELRRACTPVELPLRPFDRGDTARLAASVAGEQLDDELVAALQERAHGIPFYVEELAATLELEGRATESGRLPLPETVLDAVLLRTEALSLEARNDLESAAVVGQRVLIEFVPGAPRADAFAEVLAAGFLVEDGPGRLAFRHALVRDAIYESIPWTRRRTLHGRVARLLEAAGASAAERAAHWLGAGNVDQTRSALAEAAGNSAGIYAYRDAARLYERALDLGGGAEPVRFALLEQLAVCAELAGDLAGSARAWREVIDGQRSIGNPERVADAQHAIGRVLALRGSTERALVAWFAAADGYAACGRSEQAARSQIAAAEVLQSTGRLRPALTAVESALRDMPADGDAELCSRARSLEGRVLGKLGETTRALESVHAALAGALAAGHPPAAAAAYQAFAVVYENTGAYSQASAAYEVAIDYCERSGLDGFGDVCSVCLCHVLRQRGEWRRSMELSRSLLDNPASSEVNRAIAAAIMSQIHASRGERRPARQHVMDATPVLRRLSIVAAEMECLWTLARLELLEGSHAGALEQCREILRRWDETEDRHYSLHALSWAAGLFAACGEGEDLHRVTRALATIAADSGSQEALAMLARALGDVAALEGDLEGAIEHFRRAIDLHGEIELPHDRAELLVRAGSAAQALGLDAEAREWLVEARVEARRLGARPLQAAAERQLAGLGRTGATPSGAAGLTPRQLQVIRRVAEGRTNREIASEFTLSVRTVDMHVHNSLIALGCRSRLDAARKAGELGLLEKV